MRSLQRILFGRADATWRAWDPDDAPDAIAVRLMAAGFPSWAKLSLPKDDEVADPRSGICIVLARCDVLVCRLARVTDVSFPDREKLRLVLDLIARQRTISMPILEPAAPGAPASEFGFQTGRHRLLMLHELGAARLPIVVPRRAGRNLLDLIGG